METCYLINDVKVFGFQVETFPEGIAEAFNKLMKMLSPCDKRPYYGISEYTPEGIVYKAAALQTFEGEAAKYGLETYVVEKGAYLLKTILDWETKTNSIKSVFEELSKDYRADTKKPFVEIYKNEKEMECIIKVDTAKEIVSKLESSAKEWIRVLSNFDDKQLNTVAFKESWTAAQVGEHVIKANTSVEQSLNTPGQIPDRQPDERVQELKDVFLDFTTKLKSSNSILPTKDHYNKESLLEDTHKSFEQLIEAIETAALSEEIIHPALKQITKLEMIHVAVYHTQRHIHQLTTIAQQFL